MVLYQEGFELLWTIIEAELKNRGPINGLYFKDRKNGHTYLLEFINGNLVSSGKTAEISYNVVAPADYVFYHGETVEEKYLDIIALCEDGSEKKLTTCTVSAVDADGNITIVYKEIDNIYEFTLNLSNSYEVVADLGAKLTSSLLTYNYTDEGKYEITGATSSTVTNLTIPNNYDIIL